MESSLIAFLEVAEAAGVVESAYFLAEADDAADTLNRQHKGRVGEADAAGVPLEQGEEQLLPGDVPAAIAWREAVGMVPAKLVDTLLYGYFHLVGTLLGYHAAYGIGNERAHHVALVRQTVLIGFIFHAAGTYK